MSDNFLSQDDIDKLLNNLGEDGEITEDSGGGDDSETRLSTLSPICDLFATQSEGVLGTAVAKTVIVAPLGPCAKADFAAVKEKTGEALLSLTLSVSGGVEGDMYLIIGKKEGAVLADLMMMGTGEVEYTEESNDAISELFNQVMGSFSTALGADIGDAVNANGVSVNSFDINSPPFDASTADMSLIRLNVDGLFDSTVALIIPNSFGDEIVGVKSPAGGGMMMDGVGINQSEMDELMNMASAQSFNAGASGGGGGGDMGGGGGGMGGGMSFAPPPSMYGPPPPRTGTYDGPKENIDLLLDVELEINIELGKSELTIKRILELAPGSIVELNKMVGEPVDLIVNNKTVARGEVVVVDENFGIRIVSLVSAEDRIKSLR